MTGSQIRTKLREIIDSLVEDNKKSELDGKQPNLANEAEKRFEAIDQLVRMIKFYREDL